MIYNLNYLDCRRNEFIFSRKNIDPRERDNFCARANKACKTSICPHESRRHIRDYHHYILLMAYDYFAEDNIIMNISKLKLLLL